LFSLPSIDNYSTIITARHSTHSMSTNYDDKVEEEIPGMVYVFALTTDEEEDEEMNPIFFREGKEYKLPNAFVGGEKSSGGLCTSALLETLKTTTKNKKKGSSWADCLERMQGHIKEDRGLRRTYIPTLSTSRPIDIRNEPIRISTASSSGVKRALLIGIQYEEEDEDDVHLSSCHDDVRSMRKFLIHENGFEKQNILVILDDNGRHHVPTKKFILDSFIRLCEISEPGDSIFVQFSGHGGQLMDGNDKYNEDGIIHDLLISSDYHEKGIGPIIDDELYSLFVTKIPAGVECIAVIDPLHPPPSGNKSSALELPYMCEAGDDEVCHTNGFSPGRTRKFVASVAAAATVAGAAGVTAAKKKKKKKISEKDEKVKKKTKKNKKPKKKTKKEAIDENDDDDDNNDNERVIMQEVSDEAYIPVASESKQKDNKKKKKGLFGLCGDKEEKKEKHKDDDNKSSMGDEDYSDEGERKGKKKKGGFGLRGDKEKKKKQDDDDDDDDDDDNKSSIEEEGHSDGEEEEKQKKKKKKGAFGLRAADKEEKKKKTKKSGKKQEIVESDDDDDNDSADNSESSDEDEPHLEEPKKKKKGFFGLRGKK